jgi:UDP-N-acetylglucosamine 2-epimerase (non-hydrolysing)
VRENTERPITVSLGTNLLIEPRAIVAAARLALAGDWKRWKIGKPIPLWDGKTASRCVASLKQFLELEVAS